MNIHATKGQKVKYTGCSQEQVHYGDHDDPRNILVEGVIYTVDYTEVHDWFTNVILQEVQGRYNSVCFEDVTNTTMHSDSNKMREIKFRGCWFDSNFKRHWAYGNLTYLKEPAHGVEVGFYISNSAGLPFAYKVDEDSIGEFTGLKDKNGKEIYEGDILEFNVSYTHRGVIQYYENGFWIKDEAGTHLPNEREVIGNLYENPELLKTNTTK